MARSILLAGGTCLLFTAGFPSSGRGQTVVPTQVPETRRVDHVDDFFGTDVADPYRWLEELDGVDTAAWVEAQNEVSVAYLESLPTRESFKTRLEELWNYERYGTPVKTGARYFYSRNDGLQDQSVLYVADSLDGEPRVLIDPNRFSDDGTISLARYSLTHDGSRIAYAQSDGGTDWTTWTVRDVATGEDLDDFLDHTKFTGVSWLPDGTGFFYSRYPLDERDQADDSAPVSIYFHRLGDDQSSDRQVFTLDHPTRNPYASVTEDGRHLVISIQDGFSSNAVSWRPLADETAAVEPLFDAWDGRYDLVGNDGDRLFFTANVGAPMGQVIAIDVRSREVAVVIPESEHRLEVVRLVGGHFVALYLQDARSAVRVFDLHGQLVHEVELPGIGSASGFAGRQDDPETFFTFSGFTTPGQVFRYDVSSNRSELFREPEVGVDLGRLVTRQVFYQSQDGTRVPMFITHLAGIQLDGSHPTLLFGYGGFDLSLTPRFGLDRLVWMERGGVFAVANLRGGGEYGEKWHLAGTKERKQNVFDDFIAAAEFLIAEGYTSSEKLAIQGGSNGGLLVGASLNQRPDLFAAALPAVGVMDMLRYHLASANARAWSSDYGLAENQADFEFLHAYSPLHNIAEGTCYPPTLVTTADHDDRVVPWHSFKYAAALQHAQGCVNPIVIRVETRAGHGAGKPTWMRIEEVADAWAFLADALGM